MNELSCRYINYLSRKDVADRSTLILDMLDKYHAFGIMHLTDEQIAEYYHEVIKNERKGEIPQINPTNTI